MLLIEGWIKHNTYAPSNFFIGNILNISSGRLDAALSYLKKKKRIDVRTVKTKTTTRRQFVLPDGRCTPLEDFRLPKRDMKNTVKIPVTGTLEEAIRLFEQRNGIQRFTPTGEPIQMKKAS